MSQHKGRTVCEKCIEDMPAFLEFVRDELHKHYADKETVFEALSPKEVMNAIEFAVENPDRVGLGEADIDKLKSVREELPGASDERIIELIQEVGDVMTHRYFESDLMTIRGNLLRSATEDTILDDQKAFSTDNLSEQMIRAIQHMYFYHETRSEYFGRILDEDTIESIKHRMIGYAKSSMKALPHFDSVFLVLQEDGAIDALQTIMTGVYMEALAAGYYAGSRGTDCVMWHTHELGPVGRNDVRDEEVKVAEVMAAFDKYLRRADDAEA